MKQILLSLILLTSWSLNAQVTLSLSPDVIEMDVDPLQFETVAHSWLTNTSDETKTFRWFRIVESITTGWESAICDMNACYSTTVDSTDENTDVVLGPGDSTMIDVHVRPAGLEGDAHIKVRVMEVGNADNIIEGNYFFNQTSSSQDFNRVNLKLYPNPTRDYFQLTDYTDLDQVILYNLVGRELRRFNAFPGSKFAVSDLTRGMYLVRLVDNRRRVVKTLRLNKR